MVTLLEKSDRAFQVAEHRLKFKLSASGKRVSHLMRRPPLLPGGEAPSNELLILSMERREAILLTKCLVTGEPEIRESGTIWVFFFWKAFIPSNYTCLSGSGIWVTARCREGRGGDKLWVLRS